MGNNPLIYNDPSGHEAAPVIDWGAAKTEGLKVIEGGAKGANKGKSGGGLVGAIVGAVIGALLEPTSVGESQEEIDQSRADSVGLPLITNTSLEDYKEDNNRILVYRSLNSQDVKTLTAGQGIQAKSIDGSWDIEHHIVFGEDTDAWVADPWISTTGDPSIAFGRYSGSNYGVAVIDLAKVSSEVRFPVLELNSDTRAYELAYRDKEVLVKNLIQQNAILGIIYH